MNYRKIEIDNGINDDNELDSLLTQIAKWYNLTPKLWINNYKASNADIDETVRRIKNTRNKDLFLAIAEDDKNNIHGFIWAYKQEKIQDSVMILSLYTSEDCRGQGIATNLKNFVKKAVSKACFVSGNHG